MGLDVEGFGSFLERRLPGRKTKQPATRPEPLPVPESCGARHPNKPRVFCTLPAGHFEVEVPGIPFPMTHADLTDPEQPLAWRETR